MKRRSAAGVDASGEIDEAPSGPAVRETADRPLAVPSATVLLGGQATAPVSGW